MTRRHVYAIFSARYAPLKGGVESFTKRLAHQLAIQGDHVLVVTSRIDDSPPFEVQADGVEVYRLPCWPFLGGRLPISRKNGTYKRMLAQLCDRGIDRVLVNTRFYRHSLEGVRFAKAANVPVIVLDHGSAHLTFGGGPIDVLVQRYEHAVTRRMMRLAPYFAGISQASRTWLAHFGIETLTVIPNAIDVDEFKSLASSRDFRHELHAGEGVKLVSFVGRLEPEKGALEFAQATQLLGDGYVCAMAGDGSLRTSIETQGDTPHLLGNLEQADLSALLRDSDIFCLPTRSEGFCTSLLEAAAQGAIPVMPHVGGTDEVMGWNPTRFGVMLDVCDSARIVEGIRMAMTQEDAACISDYVAQNCSWNQTVHALDEAFAQLETNPSVAP